MGDLNHEMRAKGIGSSEIAMLVIGEDGKSLSRWGGPHKLWRIKTGVDTPDQNEQPWLTRGQALEPWILARYAEKARARLRKSPGAVRHKKYPYVVDSLDAIAWKEHDGKRPSTAVEAKAPLVFQSFHYGQENTDEIDPQYLVQGQWHMGVWGLEQCDFPVDLGTGDIKIYTSTHDEELWLSLVSIAEKFWVDHVKSGVPPPPDATKATSEWLSYRLKQKTEDILDADDDMAEKLVMLRDAKIKLSVMAEDYEKLANEVKAAIGEHKGICLPGHPKARVTFGQRKGRKMFDHEAFIRELLRRYLPADEAPPDRKDYYVEGKPYRVFLTEQLIKTEIDR